MGLTDYWRLNPPGQPDDPSRETALSLIEAMQNDGDINHHVADRCYMLFGYPELEPVAVSRWLAERSMRRPAAISSPPKGNPQTPPDHGYGLGRRD